MDKETRPIPFLRLVAFFMFASMLTACGGGGLPPAANYGTLKGVVSDRTTGALIAGAIVTVNSIQSATSGADGSYTLYPIPVGAFDWAVSATGYQGQSNQDTIEPGATKILNFSLSK